MKYVYLSYEYHSEDKEELIHMHYHYDVSLNFLKCQTFSADEEYKIEWNSEFVLFFWIGKASNHPKQFETALQCLDNCHSKAKNNKNKKYHSKNLSIVVVGLHTHGPFTSRQKS